MKLKNIDKFHRMKDQVPSMVRKTINGKEIIHGARSLNAQMQSQHLRTYTRDFDVFSPHPKKSARDTEKYLDNQMGFNAFEVQKGKHTGTFRVKSRATGETYADFTNPNKNVPFRVINGKRYATLNYHDKHSKKTLREGTATHRKGKDEDMVNRIKLNKTQNIQWQ